MLGTNAPVCIQTHSFPDLNHPIHTLSCIIAIDPQWYVQWNGGGVPPKWNWNMVVTIKCFGTPIQFVSKNSSDMSLVIEVLSWFFQCIAALHTSSWPYNVLPPKRDYGPTWILAHIERNNTQHRIHKRVATPTSPLVGENVLSSRNKRSQAKFDYNSIIKLYWCVNNSQYFLYLFIQKLLQRIALRWSQSPLCDVLLTPSCVNRERVRVVLPCLSLFRCTTKPHATFGFQMFLYKASPKKHMWYCNYKEFEVWKYFYL